MTANIEMTELYAKLAPAHTAWSGIRAKVIWAMLDKKLPREEAGKQIEHTA